MAMKRYILMIVAFLSLALPMTISSCSSDDDEESVESSIRNADKLFATIDKALKYSSAKSYDAYPYVVTRLGNYIIIKIEYGDDDYYTLLSAIKSHYGNKVEDVFLNKAGTISIEVN